MREPERKAEEKVEQKVEQKFEPKIKGSTIAVLGGGTREIDARLAELITERLKNDSSLTTIDQSTITKTIPQYPLNVNIIDFEIGKDKNKANTAWLSPQSKATIDSVQKRLNTEYVLILWSENAPIQATQGITENYISFYSRLIQYPAGKIIGYSAPEQTDAFLSLRKESKAIEKFLSNNADVIVKKVVEVIEGKK